MSVLSAQSIRRLCKFLPSDLAAIHDANHGTYFPGPCPECKELQANLVAQPINALIDPFTEHGTQNGKSYGLSACTYDCRISDGLIVPVGQSRLASTIERFCFPDNVCGSVLDKSSWARIFVSAFNTHLDPGWQGYLTVELANLGSEAAIFEPGDPLCQIKFEWLDEPTELPYSGKYQHQQAGPQKARSE